MVKLSSRSALDIFNMSLLLLGLWSEQIDLVSADGMYLIDPEYCEFSKKTRNEVESCPTDEKSWMDAAEKKKCQYTQGCTETMEYHCVINPWGNVTVEVCAPVAKILPGYCAEYNNDGGKVQEHYIPTCVECTDAYMSNEAYKYQSCYRKAFTLRSIGPESQRGSNGSEYIVNTKVQICVIVILQLCTSALLNTFE
ncbi:uncharacterized protein LOC133178543 [Saccostrea echinata]|uniref:uncharacterized protein LOC133178543 n=1 Tax=Saccostrea echinata TaxID=191078 RepID=UPI002A813C4D|nr:uncharacterized protein LOC133178543 [Saccostrea echinata]